MNVIENSSGAHLKMPVSFFEARTGIGFIFSLRYNLFEQLVPGGLKRVLTRMMVSAGFYVDQLSGSFRSTNKKVRITRTRLERLLRKQQQPRVPQGLTGSNNKLRQKSGTILCKARIRALHDGKV